MERGAREKMAGERETLLSDLRISQNRNQELVEQLEEVRKLNANIYCIATNKRSPAPPPHASSPAASSTAPPVTSPASPSATGNKVLV
ncbi:hypothetical protein EVAR_40984_1 [Eumeta japonica]|uniref:Uncharacterized protein n=1 Tax=Eumeta variegata TaxID=151549 RepID=A0A4C1XDN7_EUMVA|nr:hypothetical protein EVAR_40984_1 [Eumeta japonica]